MQDIDDKNIRGLLHITGKPGLHLQLERKASSIMVQNIETEKVTLVDPKNCTYIGSWYILHEDGSKIDAVIGLENLYNWVYENEDNPREIPTENLGQLRSIICPGYNPFAFKPYHVKKLIRWFRSLETYFKNRPQPDNKTEQDLVDEIMYE